MTRISVQWGDPRIVGHDGSVIKRSNGVEAGSVIKFYCQSKSWTWDSAKLDFLSEIELTMTLSG